jgi:hypothetical protein
MKAHGSWLDGFVRWFVNASPADIDERDLALFERDASRNRRIQSDARRGQADRRSPTRPAERRRSHP